MIVIGIDTGVNTGVAVWSCSLKKFFHIGTCKIHEAMKMIEKLLKLYDNIIIIVEDARQRKWFGSRSNLKLQGAGSIKRDCTIWDDYLKDLKVNYKMIHPIKGATKIDKELFKKVTGWKKRTSEHARDAAMMVFNYKQ